MASTLKHVVWVSLLGGLLAGCGDNAAPESKALALPAQLEQAHITDQARVAGLDLVVEPRRWLSIAIG